VGVSAPVDIDSLSLAALKSLVVQLLSKSAEQERLIAELRLENARLKGLNGRPRIKPSGMEPARDRKRLGQGGKRRFCCAPDTPTTSSIRRRWTICAGVPWPDLSSIIWRHINHLATHRQTRFADQAAWQMHLHRLGISALQVTPDPVCIATEGALLGSIQAHGLLRDRVIVSDDAGPFAVGQHALCWVHAERLVHKLDTFTDLHRGAQQRMRALIWWLYDDLKAYRAEPTARRYGELRARFERIFRRPTGFVTLDRRLKRLHANKPELPMVRDRPEIPLHTNGSERDIRLLVTKRKISGGTRSLDGRDCRDGFLGLMQTAATLGIAFWDYLADRLSIPDHPTIPYFARPHPLARSTRLIPAPARGAAPLTSNPRKALILAAIAGNRVGSKMRYRN